MPKETCPDEALHKSGDPSVIGGGDDKKQAALMLVGLAQKYDIPLEDYSPVQEAFEREKQGAIDRVLDLWEKSQGPL